jgi:hypothetical protein
MSNLAFVPYKVIKMSAYITSSKHERSQLLEDFNPRTPLISVLGKFY